MRKKLSKKEKGFADDYLETGNGVQSALKNYDTDNYNSANQIALENLQKPTIQQYLEENAHDAMSRVVELSKSAQNETVRLGANKDILDRAGYKPIDRAVNITINTKSIDPTDPDIIKNMQAIQEKLENE